jgi:hypothetical protein
MEVLNIRLARVTECGAVVVVVVSILHILHTHVFFAIPRMRYYIWTFYCILGLKKRLKIRFIPCILYIVLFKENIFDIFHK